jgi:hypothetical protein
VTEEVIVEIDLSEEALVVLGDSELVAGIREIAQRPVAPLVQAVAVEADDFAELVDVWRKEGAR